jgi:hypothetical protein
MSDTAEDPITKWFGIGSSFIVGIGLVFVADSVWTCPANAVPGQLLSGDTEMQTVLHVGVPGIGCSAMFPGLTNPLLPYFVGLLFAGAALGISLLIERAQKRRDSTPQ